MTDKATVVGLFPSKTNIFVKKNDFKTSKKIKKRRKKADAMITLYATKRQPTNVDFGSTKNVGRHLYPPDLWIVVCLFTNKLICNKKCITNSKSK